MTITGQWYRSAEEEEGAHLVYRGPSFDFPRARAARPSIRLHEDGGADFGTAGPADAPRMERGTWEREGELLRLSGPDGTQEFHIDRLDDEVMVLTKR